MNSRLRSVVVKLVYGVFFLYLALVSSGGPAGHLEPQGSAYAAPAFILLCGVVVISGKWKRAHVHLAWGCITLALFLSSYREICHYKMDAKINRDALLHDARMPNATKSDGEVPIKNKANPTAEPTSPSRAGSS